MSSCLTASLFSTQLLQQRRHVIKISNDWNRKFHLCKINFPRGGPRTNAESSTDIENASVHDSSVWSDYVKRSVKSDSLEKHINTSFGHIRVDSQNIPTYHGQQDEYDKVQEEALGNESSALLQDLDSAETHEVKGTSSQVVVPQSVKLHSVSENKFDTQESMDRFNPTVIEFDDHLNNSYKTRLIETKVIPTNRRSKSKDAISSEPMDNSIDEHYFGKILKNNHDYTNPKVGPTATFENINVDNLNAVDQQYFSHLNGISVEKISSFDEHPPSEMKQLRQKDVVSKNNDTLNYIDSQMFEKDQPSDPKDTFSFPVKKNKSKSKPKRSETKNTALEYVKKMRPNFKFEPHNSNQKYTKEQEVSRLGESLQKKMGRVAMNIKAEQTNNEKSPTPNDSAIENTSGRVPTQFLPVDLEALTKVEIEEIIKRNVVYNDNDIVAIHKPYGLQMFGESRRSRHSVESLLSCLFDTLNVTSTENWPGLMPVHRLDKNTTGILLCAKTEEMHNKLTNLFRERKIEKRYWAILNGTPDPEEAIIDIPLGEVNLNGRIRQTVRPDYSNSVATNKKIYKGKILPAVTEYKVINTKGNAALVEAKTKTGIKHQVRAHFGLGLNTPILGDHKYSHVKDLGIPQKIHGDILHRLTVRKSRSRDLPFCFHAKRVLIPEIIPDRFIAIDCSLPHHFVKIMKKLGLKPNSHVR